MNILYKSIAGVVLVIIFIGSISLTNNYRIAINKIKESQIDNTELSKELRLCREELQKINQKLERF